MNDNQSNENNVVKQQVDPRTVEAEVLGELRKDKIGKPILVVELFVLFAIVLIALPVVNNLLNNETSFLYKFLHPNDIMTPIIPPNEDEEVFLNGGELQPLGYDTNMRYEAIVMRNFILSSNKIKVTIYSYTGEIDLDKDDYYLEVYSASDNYIAATKLSGLLDNREQDVELYAKNLSFNTSLGYKGKIVKMDEDKYPEVNIQSDESGLGSFICKRGNHSIEYTFMNKYLVKITDEERILLEDEESNSKYLAAKQEYENKANDLGEVALVEEVSDGFRFYADLDLENYKIPESVKDLNYFPVDSKAKIVRYTLEAKGFDCGD